MIEASKLWEAHYGKEVEVEDFAGRKIQKKAYGKEDSSFCWNIDHAIASGRDDSYNLLPCHIDSNRAKADKNSWKDKDKNYQVKTFKILSKDSHNYKGKGYGYCLLNEDGTYEVVAATKVVK